MYWYKVGLFVWKDLLIEYRAREFLSSMGVFGLLVLVLYNFSFSLGREELREVLPGLLWLAYLFAGVLGLNRAFAAEREFRAIKLISLLAEDRSAIFMGKLLSNLIFMWGMQLLLTPVSFAFFGIQLEAGLGMLLLVLLLGSIGIMAPGTFLAALASESRAQEVLLPILLFPLLTPVVIGAVQLTAELMQTGAVASSAAWLYVLAACDLVFLALPFFLFEYLLEV